MKHITAKEQEVLDLMCLGKTDKDIAQILGIAENTVGRHIITIRLKLDADNRTQAVAKFLAPHLFTRGSP